MKTREIKIIVIIFTISLIFIQYSCWTTEERNYKCEITNLTGYKINSLELGNCSNGNRTTVSIEPYSKSEVFNLNVLYTVGFESSRSPFICIAVLSYSDSLKTYTNTVGRTHEQDELSESKTNKFNVELNNYPIDEYDSPFIITQIK